MDSPDQIPGEVVGGSIWEDSLAERCDKVRRGTPIIAIIVAVLIIGASAGTVLVLNHRVDVAAQARQAVADRKAEAARQAEAKRQAEVDAKWKAEAKQAARLAAAQAKLNARTQQASGSADLVSELPE